jgi:DNA-binding transcriptional ArsR family regulator
MSSGAASLHKVLKDKTRRKIVLLLNEKRSLSYTDILDSLSNVSTGLLNYHLKILDDLLTKNNEGQYTLTEKGKLASRLLLEYPEGSLEKMRKWERKFWKAALIIAVGVLIIHLVAYFLGYIELSGLYRGLLWIVPAISIIYLFEHIVRDLSSQKIRSKYLLANYYARGIVIGLLLWFALTIGLGLGVSSGLVSLVFLGRGGQITLQIASLIVCCVIGSLINKRQCGLSPTE